MKTTIDIPDAELKILQKLTMATTKREALLVAIREYNHRHAAQSLIETFGTWDLQSNDEIEAAELVELEGKR